MQVTVDEFNKNANLIINQACFSDETVTILKHGKPIARISPVTDSLPVEGAVNYLPKLEPVDVQDPIESVNNHLRL